MLIQGIIPCRFAILLFSPLSLNLASGELNSEILSPIVVTAEGGFPVPMQSSAWATNQIQLASPNTTSRSMPEALSGLPSIMVQKTALGQSSPYIRGLTGYHNLLLIDGIRLNHSAMRSGPNQYWSTVEHLGADHIEVVRGPNGIIHGADAVGGVVNLLYPDPFYSGSEVFRKGEIMGRLSSAEQSWSTGLMAELSTPQWFTELSHSERSFGDLEGGKEVGRQSNTGYDTKNSQIRLSRKLNDHAQLILGFQKNKMDDVPRTHKTIDGLNWKGLSPGSEIWRFLDQERTLYYGKLSWKNAGGLADVGLLTLSMHRHEQERRRMKKPTSGGDFQYFDLWDLGLSARLEAESPWGGRFAYGADWHRESLVSGGYKFDDSELKISELAQGQLAADAQYNRFSLYGKETFETEAGWVLEPGIRFSSARADLDRFYLNNSIESSIQDPMSKNYRELIGGIRVSRVISDDCFLFAGLSQGFRPPSLYDLTSTDETSAVEKPNTTLAPEKFLQAEIGLRGKSTGLSWNLSTYHTWIKDLIVRSPVESGKSEVLKSNGDGSILGIELEFEYQWSSSWKSGINLSWMESEIEQLLDDNVSGTISINGRNYLPVDRATTRSMPIQTQFRTQYISPDSKWWGEISILAVGKAENLSLKDLTDLSRIPSGGTPRYALFSLKGGRHIGNAEISLAMENLGDVDYRVHGSGVNGAGRNFILSFNQSF